jgi:inner membrane protein
MTDDTLPPPFPASPAPPRPGPGRQARAFLASDNLLARASVLGFLTLLLIIPLNMIGGVIADRRTYEAEATRSVSEAWGAEQTFVGPMILVPFRRTVGNFERSGTLTLLPEKLTVDGHLQPQQRRRGLFAVNVYTARLDVTAEFQTRALRDLLADSEPDWPAARLEIGVSDSRSIDGNGVDIDGQWVDWASTTGSLLSSLKAAVTAAMITERDTVALRFRIAIAGSGKLAVVPLGRRTEVTLAAPWPSPSFTGRLPLDQAVDRQGFTATWMTSDLGRPYSQLWDSASLRNEPAPKVVLDSAFGVTLLTPVDAYRETDRAIKYGIMFIGLTFAASLLFELATGTRPHAAQYGLIGLSLCVFYLLLLSISEQIGFGPAYLASAAAVVAQATVYSRALQGRTAPALAFGAILASLFGGLYGLLQLEDVALLAGSLVLFAVLSVAMGLTRNLHRPQPA